MFSIKTYRLSVLIFFENKKKLSVQIPAGNDDRKKFVCETAWTTKTKPRTDVVARVFI